MATAAATTRGVLAVAAAAAGLGPLAALAAGTSLQAAAVAEGSMLRRSFQGSAVEVWLALKARSWCSLIRGLVLAEQTHPRAHRRSGFGRCRPVRPLSSGMRVAAAAAGTARSILLCLAGQILQGNHQIILKGLQARLEWHRTAPATVPSRVLGQQIAAPQALRSPPAAPGRVARSARSGPGPASGEPDLSRRFVWMRFVRHFVLPDQGEVTDRVHFGRADVQGLSCSRRAVASNNTRQQVDACAVHGNKTAPVSATTTRPSPAIRP